MFENYPIYTLENDCQDCCRCVRRCPVKAISVENGSARIIPGLCIACGICVEVCPAGVKTIRDDSGSVKEYLEIPHRSAYASLAPSWVNEFPGISESAMVEALSELGFKGTSETALGAEQAGAANAEMLRNLKTGLMISTNCPSVVDYIENYLHELVECLTPFQSPLLAHCRLLKKHLGQKARVIHFGPCISAKLEADRYPDLLHAALTFKDLKKWFHEKGIWPENSGTSEKFSFLPQRSTNGALYAMEGGMSRMIKNWGRFKNVNFVSISGIYRIREALETMRPEMISGPVFLECHACPGGCINGPCSDHSTPTISRITSLRERTSDPILTKGPSPDIHIEETYRAKGTLKENCNETEIIEALRKLGKSSPEDELNCGGCGYDTCRDFAKAMISGMAEPTMCVSWMREKARKKSNALMRSMPSGVVIIDREMKIIECNRRFAELFGENILQIYEAQPGLKGADLSRIISFSHLFKSVIESDRDFRLDHFKYGERLFEIVIFSIDPHETVGGVILDVTKREMRRDEIAHQANEVINKNLTTVQEIACMLGEHMADTEILLRSIAEGYGGEEKKTTIEKGPGE